jgi:hypothetical protein
MSYITIHVYDGDPAEYRDEDETNTVGTRVEEHTYSDGEELDAAKEILGYLAEFKHFDVRMWAN